MDSRNKTYVSDVIGQSFKQWKPGYFYFISAGTGTGKSTFVIEQLLSYARETKQRILYLVNREALRIQLQTKIDHSKNHWTTEDDQIKVMTYQGLEKIIKSSASSGIQNYHNHFWSALNNKRSLSPEWNDFRQYVSVFSMIYGRKIDNMYCHDLNGNQSVFMEYQFFAQLFNKCIGKYDYIVCDEAHYFFHDSIFNTNTVISYKSIIGVTILAGISGMNQTTRCLFMSATMGKLRNQIKEDLEKFKDELMNRQDLNIYERNYKVSEKLVDIGCVPADYSHIKMNILNDLSEIPDLVTSNKNKWIVFVNDKERGKKLERDINKRSKKDLSLPVDEEGDDEPQKEIAIFIDAEYEENFNTAQTMNMIAQEERFERRVLITTSVLDNGTSISDTDVTHLIILTDIEDEFIQMLGRRRFRQNDCGELCVYIHNTGLNNFVTRLNRVIRSHKYVYEKYCKVTQEQMQDYLLESEDRKFLVHMLMSFCGTYVWNDLSIRRYEQLEHYYEDMISRMQNDKRAYLIEVFSWIGRTEDDVKICLKEWEKDIVPALLEETKSIFEEYLDRKLDDLDERKKMRNRLCGKRYKHGPLRKLIDIKEMGDAEKLDSKVKNAINKYNQPISDNNMQIVIEYLDLPYIVISEGKNYRIERNQK